MTKPVMVSIPAASMVAWAAMGTPQLLSKLRQKSSFRRNAQACGRMIERSPAWRPDRRGLRETQPQSALPSGGNKNVDR